MAKKRENDHRRLTKVTHERSTRGYDTEKQLRMQTVQITKFIYFFS